jgi:3-hydroxybutyryl-CoA dehydrogenase
MKILGVLGGGMMGADIALAGALAGYSVLMKEINMESAVAGKKRIRTNLDFWRSKGKINADDNEAEKVLHNVKAVDSFDGFDDADIVIEAVFEDEKVKAENYRALESICKPSCIIASNTSSISITRLAASLSSTERRSKFVGMHFFSPASIMKLVEVIKGEETAPDTMDAAEDFCRSISKEPVRVVDCPGFVVNRILYAISQEAMRVYEEGIASIEDIDKALQLGAGHPIGPFALMDLTNNNLNLKIGRNLFEAYGERCRPSLSLIKKVDAGHLGKKTGKGWYDYAKKK